jgi:hypothetical protein
MRFGVITAVKMSLMVFWAVTPCGIVDRYRRFGGTYCLQLQGKTYKTSRLKMEAVCSSETLVSTYSPHSVTIQKTYINRIK